MEKRSLHARLCQQHKAPPASLHPELRGRAAFPSPVPWDQPPIPAGTLPARLGLLSAEPTLPRGAAPFLPASCCYHSACKAHEMDFPVSQQSSSQRGRLGTERPFHPFLMVTVEL